MRNYRRVWVLQKQWRNFGGPIKRTNAIGGYSSGLTVPCHRLLSCSSSLRREPERTDFINSSSDNESFTEDDLSLLDIVEESPIDINSTVEAVEQSFHFKDIFLMFPNAIESVLQHVHAMTGMPWWLTIATCTIAARTSMVPLMLHMRRVAKKLTVIQPRLNELRNESAQYAMAGDHVRSREASDKMKKLCEKHGVHIWMTTVPMLCQGTLFASFFFALRHMTMADSPMAGLTTEGPLWFSNLTLPDPFYILPIVNCVFISSSLLVSLAYAVMFVTSEVCLLALVCAYIYIYICVPFCLNLMF